MHTLSNKERKNERYKNRSNIKYLEGTQRVFDPETTLANTTKLLPRIGVTPDCQYH